MRCRPLVPRRGRAVHAVARAQVRELSPNAPSRHICGAVIGDVMLAWISGEHLTAEIGFTFHPDHHGDGFASEAAAELLRLGFGGLGLHRIIGRCDARNTPSAVLGMWHEAHFRVNECIKGGWTDEYVYALLAHEWAAHLEGTTSQRPAR